jgi:3-oxoacyl-[acyl-carrier-protein] synthase I
VRNLSVGRSVRPPSPDSADDMTPRFTPVLVGSIGSVTAVGLTAVTTAAAVRAGIAGFNALPFLVDGRGDQMIVAAVPGLPPPGVDVQRFLDLALPAAHEALSVMRNLAPRPAMPLCLALPGRRPGILDGLAIAFSERLSEALAEHCRFTSVTIMPTGHAGGLAAMDACARRMREDGADFGLVGGVDSYISAETLEWLESEERLHTAANPWGFIPGEAAGFCLLTTAAGSAKLGKVPLLSVEHVALAIERNVMRADGVCTGQGLTAAIQGALKALPEEAKADDIICDLNAEPYRADEYGFTIPRISDRCRDAVGFQNPADCWGDVGAASGPLFVALGAAAAQKAYASGPYTLVWNSSDSGERAAALLAMPGATAG